MTHLSEKLFHPLSQYHRTVDVSAYHGHRDLLSLLMTTHSVVPFPVPV